MRWLRWVFVAYLAVVAYGVFGPEPGDEVNRAAARLREIEAQVRGRGDATTTTAVTIPGTPLPSIVATTLAPAPLERTDRLFDDLSAPEFFNILLFVPLGLLFPLCWPRWRWATVPLGIALSSAIELVQGAFLDWRSQTLIDVQTNSLGALLGFAAYLALVLAVPRLRAPRVA